MNSENYTPNQVESKKRNKIVNILNGSVLVLMLLLCLIPDSGGILAFSLGCILSLINFILMIVYFATRYTMAGVYCIIWMLLLPIVGFGCCAATFNYHP